MQRQRNGAGRCGRERPDPVEAPGAYSSWLRVVTRPATRVGAVSRPELIHHAAGSRDVTDSGNWAGTAAVWTGAQ